MERNRRLDTIGFYGNCLLALVWFAFAINAIVDSEYVYGGLWLLAALVTLINIHRIYYRYIKR